MKRLPQQKPKGARPAEQGGGRPAGTRRAAASSVAPGQESPGAPCVLPALGADDPAIHPPSRPNPLQVSLRALSAADRSRVELDARLERRGFDDDERRQALDELERLGYLDDERTAALRAERLADRGYGDAYIRADLEHRGLPTEEALAAIEPERERIERFATKGQAWLARRGFASEG